LVKAVKVGEASVNIKIESRGLGAACKIPVPVALSEIVCGVVDEIKGKGALV